MRIVCELPLRGAGGEPISFARTVHSHGCAALAPAEIESSPLVYRRRLRLGGRVCEIAISARGKSLVVRASASLRPAAMRVVEATVARMFRLDADLSDFYAQIVQDTALSWAARGAGRILASPTVFEDVIKTICTTNCAWSATIRMTRALAELGGGAFPEAQALVATPDAWYREVAKMGYRGPYVRAIAREVASGALDLESLRNGTCDDSAAEQRLLALPGIGPYGAAHVLQLLGRHRRLVLDSWTRPKYLRVSGKKRAKDSTIARAFARHGAYAGLAFWLYLTRDWLEEE